MILEQLYLDCLSQASYLIADEATGVAAVVDPRRDVDVYLETARKLGVTIRHVVLTHFHADFVSGHLELRERTGATIHLGARARTDYPSSPLAEGDEIVLGGVRLVALETPGHTPEGISILVFDDQRSAAQPQAVLTGDTLFVGDVGRPDLMASVGVSAEELAGMLYDSLHGKLLRLPDATRVYPGHGAGSMCGKALSKETMSTIGEQRRLNYALQPMPKEEFVALVTADQPAAPAYFGHDADLNRRERPTLERSLEQLAALPLDRVLALAEGGARVLDVRAAADYAAGHLPGSLNVALDGRFATWAGTLLEPGAEIVLVADPGREREAALRLGRIGLDRVAGYLQGGARTLEARPERLRSHRRISPAELARLRQQEPPPCLLDVRGAGEWSAGHVENTLHVPLAELEARIDEVPRNRDVVVTCQGGYRSSMACGLLERHGRERFVDLTGGMGAWVESGLPVVADAPA